MRAASDAEVTTYKTRLQNLNDTVALLHERGFPCFTAPCEATPGCATSRREAEEEEHLWRESWRLSPANSFGYRKDAPLFAVQHIRRMRGGHSRN